MSNDAKKYFKENIESFLGYKLINNQSKFTRNFTLDYSENWGIFQKPDLDWKNFLPKLKREWKYALPKELINKYYIYFQIFSNDTQYKNNGYWIYEYDYITNKYYYLQTFINYEKDYDNKKFVMKKYDYTTDEEPKNDIKARKTYLVPSFTPKFITYTEASLNFKKKTGYLIIKNNHPTEPLDIKIEFDMFGFGENY